MVCSGRGLFWAWFVLGVVYSGAWFVLGVVYSGAWFVLGVVYSGAWFILGVVYSGRGLFWAPMDPERRRSPGRLTGELPAQGVVLEAPVQPLPCPEAEGG